MMDFLFTLKEDIDLGIMEKAMQRCMKRYPYFSFRMIQTDTGLDMVENPLPVTVGDSISQEIVLGSSDVNYHWIAAACEGKKLRLSMSHLMADGRSALWFYKTLLWCYLTERYQLALDSAGIRHPESPVLPDEDIKAETLLEDAEDMNPQSVTDPFLLPEENTENRWYKIKIPAREFMAFGKSNDSSPVALLSVFMAQMFCELFPENEKAIYSSVAADIRKAVHTPNSHFTNTNVIFIRHDPKKMNRSYEELGTMTRGQLILQGDPVNLRYKYNALLRVQAAMAKAKDPSEQQRLMASAYQLVTSNPTYSLSYVGDPEWRDLEPFIEEEFTLVDGRKLCLEVNYAGGNFCICWVQKFDSTRYIEAFQRLLRENGIPCDVAGPYPMPHTKCRLI